MSSYDYYQINMGNALEIPSTVHCKDTNLVRYYAKYLLQKVLSVYKWTLPETWDYDYFQYIIATQGYIAVFDTPEFGVICQMARIGGYDIFYRPTTAMIANPIIGTLERQIRKDCALIKFQPDYSSPLDICMYYADLMAIAAQGAAANIFNSKLAYVFACQDKASAESFKKAFDQINAGNPAVFVDKSLFNDSGEVNWHAFQQKLNETYIADKILSDLRKIETMFDSEIGIPNANTDKKERLITSEVESNTVEVYSKVELWLDTMKRGIDEANRLFPGLNLGVDLRFGGVDNASNNVNPGAVQLG